MSALHFLAALTLALLSNLPSFHVSFTPGDCNDTLIELTNITVRNFHIPSNTSELPDNPISEGLLTQDNRTVWCFNDSVATYLEINLTAPYQICAVETQGIRSTNNETKYLSSYLLEAFVDVSANCTEWWFYTRTGNVTVLEGNTYEDPFATKKNDLTDGNLIASAIRIWPVLSNESCTQLKLYGQKISFLLVTNTPAQTSLLQVYNSSSTSLIISWPAPADGEVSGYVIKLTDRTNTTGLYNVTGPETQLEVHGLYRYSRYCVTLTVVTEGQPGIESGNVCALTAIDGPADAPENLTVTNATSTSLLLSWDHSRPYFSNISVTAFQINVTDESGRLLYSLDAQHSPEEKNITGLNEDTEYCMTVSARVRQGNLGSIEGQTSDVICAFTNGKDGFTEWSSWGQCNASCGGGQQSRTRACTNPSVFCSGEETEGKSCNNQPCYECSEEWSQFGDYCYKVADDEVKWNVARTACVDVNADLASISNQFENDFIRGLMENLNVKDLWIGLHSKEDKTLAWTDGTPYDFMAFPKGEPSSHNENCVKFSLSISGWNDQNCGITYPYICKRKVIMPCKSTTIGMESGRIADILITSNSSVPGFEAKKARLNHPSGWCADLVTQPYFQVNLNATYLVCAIATQGSGNSSKPAFATEYKVSFSIDGSKWDFYRESGGVQYFPGNNDTNTVQKSVLLQTVFAQYMRVWPTKWYVVPCMRIELFGMTFGVEDGKTPLLVTGVTPSGEGLHMLKISWEKTLVYQSIPETLGYKIMYHPLTESQTNMTITVNSDITSYKILGLKANQTYCVRVLAYNAYGDGESSNCTEITTAQACLLGWVQFQSDCYLFAMDDIKSWDLARIECLDKNSDLVYILTAEEDQFIESQLINKSTVSEVFIGLNESGDNSNRFPHWSSGDSVDFTNWQENTTAVVLNGTACVAKNKKGQWAVVDCTENKPYICKRRGFYLNNTLCSENGIGMETGIIPDSSITASSTHDPNYPWKARLGSFDGWRPPSSAAVNSFLQIDLGSAHYVCAVATQGNSASWRKKRYVTRYRLGFSLNGISWLEYEQKLSGANHNYQVKKNELNTGVVAQFVQFLPEEWNETPNMRVEVYGTPASPFPAPTKSPTIPFAQGISSTSIQFDLSFPRPYYAAYDVTGYTVRYWRVGPRVQRSVIDELSTEDETFYLNGTLPVGNTTVTLAGLEVYTEYCVSVQLVSVFGSGPFGFCTTVMTLEGVPDLPPVEITAEASSSTSLVVSWHPVPFGHVNGVVTGYKVFYIDAAETQSRSNVTVAANNVTAEVTGLLLYTNYCIQVLAFTSQGDGNLSDCLITLTGEGGPSAPPSEITIRSTGMSSLLATWKPVPSGHENGVIMGYKVFYVDTAQSQPNISINVSWSSLSMNLTDLLVYTEYCVQVLAFTRGGEGVLSNCVTASTDEGVPTAVPTNASAFVDLNNNTISLSWGPVPKDGVNGELLAYAILIKADNATVFLAPCYSSVELTNLTVSTEICIQMAAVTKVGFGKLTDCVAVNFDLDTTPVTVTATKEMNLTSINVTWVHPTKHLLGGNLLAYFIEYQAISQGGKPIPESEAEPASTTIVCATYSGFMLMELASYTTYKIVVYIITTDGKGNGSEPVYGETCRCAEYLATFLLPSPFDTFEQNSLTKTISDLVTSTCGRCKGHSDSDITKLTPADKNQTIESTVSFPVTMTKPFGNTGYSKFVPIISVPGVVIVRRKNNDNSGLLTQITANSVFNAWPVFLITLLIALLAGIIIWILDTGANEDHFPRTFFKGAGEGFWWSFISMTTVGYGDRCPQSIPAKIFAMVWFLVGLIIFAIFMGSLASILTVTVVKMDSGGVGVGVKDDGKVAVVSNSSEFQMAIKKFRNKVSIGSMFPNLSSMVQALRDGNISSALVEMYVPVKRKDLFNGSWFEVSDILKGEIQHGVLLQGEGVKLAVEMKTLTLKNNIQTNYLQDGEVESSEGEATSMIFFEPSSPYYLVTIIISAGLLLVATVCGLLYQNICYKRFCLEIGDEEICSCSTTKREFADSVETFYHNFSETYHRLHKIHKAERIKFMLKARAASRTKAT